MIKYRIKRGDTVPVEVEYRLDDLPIDLYGLTPMLVAKEQIGDALTLFSKSGTASVPTTNGKAVITLTGTDTATVCRNAIMEALVVDGSGNKFTHGQFLLDIDDDVYA